MNSSAPRLTVPRTDTQPSLPSHESPLWQAASAVQLDWFHARSSDHRPKVTAHLMHDGAWLYLRYDVHDRFVRSIATRPNGNVWEDSCVEFFVEPVPGGGYFNFEFNAGGTLLIHHNLGSGPTRHKTELTEAELAQVQIRTTLARVIEPEITEPLTWHLTARIPVRLFEHRLGRPVPIPGLWRGNLYKCADKTSHPHWGAWSPVGDPLNFHQPAYFGELELT